MNTLYITQLIKIQAAAHEIERAVDELLDVVQAADAETVVQAFDPATSSVPVVVKRLQDAYAQHNGAEFRAMLDRLGEMMPDDLTEAGGAFVGPLSGESLSSADPLTAGGSTAVSADLSDRELWADREFRAYRRESEALDDLIEGE